MMLILIGSNALQEHIKIDRTPMDTDLIGKYDAIVAYAKDNGSTSFVPINNGKYIKMTFGKEIVEAEIAWPNSSAEAILNHVIYDDYGARCCGRPWTVPSINVLYMLKMSHRFKKNSPHFLKTMNDIHLMRKHGAIIDSSLESLYKLRQKETYNYNHPKLNQNKENFFKDDGIKYTFDHDSIHESVKMFASPAYSYFKKDNFCGRDIQLAAVYEESCVLAIERALVPFPHLNTPKRAFEIALMKVCTSITSGWFRAFAWENYHEVLKIDPNCDFWMKFLKDVSDGKVPLHKG
jgi:hypothetical protein